MIHKSRKFFSLIKKIKLFVIDCDGVMTDGGIYINKKGESFRRFDVKDGLGIKMLHSKKIDIACISGSNSTILEIRAKSLGIKIIRKGISDKLIELKKIQQELGFDINETMFLGDDINDLRVIDSVGIFAVPYDAHEACKKKADFIGKKKGGKGFIREVVDFIFIAKGMNPYEPLITKNDFEI
tara:strand:+ start:1296 stop:1844 length:549 start_codon:yes stop_codon:yes gene_type:complete